MEISQELIIEKLVQKIAQLELELAVKEAAIQKLQEDEDSE